ncbi:hypothetical protein EDF60_1660 [Leucobacter luti]|nr:hypothetical protein [Leucobacter luti]TCK41234.1 hypothetical protein EDF60_1660 [Leucobacter luti]
MRLSQLLVNEYPRRLIWWMECDVCRKTRSAPAWSQDDLPLSKFRDAGWRCRMEHPMDTCPDCLRKEVHGGVVSC